MTKSLVQEQTPPIFGRLVSLADIMKQFPAASFLDIHLQLRETITAAGAVPDGDVFIHEPGAFTQQQQRSIEALYLEYGFRASAASWSRIAKLYADSTATWGAMRNEYHYLERALQDEMEGSLYFAIDPGKEHFISGSDLFGEQVSERFVSAGEDIEEAGKCLAFARGTACVFHLMRVLELALRALMKDMEEPYEASRDSDWSKMLAKCSQHVASAGSKQDFYRGAITMLTTVKFTWRNPTMHPKNVYTEEEAREVWDAVRVFTRHLATELHE